MSNILDINQMDQLAQQFANKYFLIRLTRVLAFAIAETFIILFLISELSYFWFGVLMATQFTLQSVLDYPTGALSDLIGQKKVLLVAYIFHCISVCFLIISTTFFGYLIAIVISSIGYSQESGALESWFDNSYTHYNKGKDADKAIFGQFQGKILVFESAIRGIAFVLGGIIATIYSRRFLLLMHLIILIVTISLISKYVMQLDIVKKQDINLKNYLTQLKDGFDFIISNRAIFLTFIGLAITFGAVSAVWFNQVLFPYYESYSGEDQYTGLLRSLVFTIGIIWTLLATRVSKRVSNTKIGLIIGNIGANPLFFLLCYFYFIIIPPLEPPMFRLLPYIGVVLLFGMVGFWDSLTLIFFDRFKIQEVPSEIRNTIYSLFPTMTSIFSIIFSLIGGLVLETYSFEFGILLSILLSLIGSLVMGYGLKSF
jgi:MFS family permease